MAAAIVGGTTSALTGGKFANGAVTAAFAHLFNAEGRSIPRKWVDLGEGYTGGFDAAPYKGYFMQEVHIYKNLPADPTEMNPSELKKYEEGVIGPDKKHKKSLSVSDLPKSVQVSLRNNSIARSLSIYKHWKGTHRHRDLKTKWLEVLQKGPSVLGGGLFSAFSLYTQDNTHSLTCDLTIGLDEEYRNAATGGCFD